MEGNVSLRVCRWTHRNGQVIAARQFRDFADVPETSAHDDGLVSVLLVVVEDSLHALDPRVVLGRIPVLLLVGLVPIQNPADERRDEEGTSLGGGNGLWKGEHKSKVAVDLVFGLEGLGGLDTLPC